MIHTDIVVNILQNPEITTVSLSLFDTLVEVPGLSSNNIFVLIDDKAREIIGNKSFSFYKERKKFENNIKHASAKNYKKKIYDRTDFFDHIANRYSLTPEQKYQLLQIEMEIISELSLPRIAAQQIYQAALQSGKKVVCVINRKYPEEFIMQLLQHKGYDSIDAIYYIDNNVASYQKLFDDIVKKHDLRYHQLLHIGSNYHNDYLVPLQKGICAYHLPDSNYIFKNLDNEYTHLWENTTHSTAYTQLLAGFYMHKWAETLYDSGEFYPTKKDFGYFGLGPLLFVLIQRILHHKAIHKRFSILQFPYVSGYLLERAYHIITEHSKKQYATAKLVNIYDTNQIVWNNNTAIITLEPLKNFKRKIIQIAEKGTSITVIEAGVYKGLPARYSRVLKKLMAALCSYPVNEQSNMHYHNGESINTVLHHDSKASLTEIQVGALQFIQDFTQWLSVYSDCMYIDDVKFASEPLLIALNAKQDRATRHLADIITHDENGNSIALIECVEPGNTDYLKRTELLNRQNVVTTYVGTDDIPKLKIGIHIHLFHVDLAYSFIARLCTIPVPFDCFISVCSQSDMAVVKTLFTNTVLPCMQCCTVRVVPNRGRDVAPWIITFGNEQRTYDLFCHLHTKRSVRHSYGEEWREYLLDNLITGKAVADIVRYFANNSQLGVIFPPVFYKILKKWFYNNNTPLEESDKKHCDYLLSLMKIDSAIHAKTILFPAGTMLWYRPDALEPLFNVGLTLDDFPEEPIGVTGTIAHAIERLPAVIAKSRGYTTLCYIDSNKLIQYYFDSFNAMFVSIRAKHFIAGVCNFLFNTIKLFIIRRYPPETMLYRILKSMKDTIASPFKLK